MRTVTLAHPNEIDKRGGLAYSLWLPDAPLGGGVVILHGAGSCKENHHDFGRAAIAAGFAALAFDQRGHGGSAGPMAAGALDDIAAMTDLLRDRMGDPAAPVALRGSSMGGFLSILAAGRSGARAVIAICPASAAGLRRGLRSGAFTFDADVDSLERMLSDNDLHDTVRTLEIPVLLLHAEGDEQVPVEHSRELARELSAPSSRLIALPGGHHRSVQHDPELCAISLRWLAKALR
jgi:alpha-beta hydrolase superfamily lysophospholipase